MIFGVFRAQAGRIAEENRFRSPVTGSVRLSLTRGRIMLCAYARRVPGQPRHQRGCPMASDREERNRVFGMPRGVDPSARQGEEPQRVLGVPVDWYGPVDRDRLRSLRHPVKAYKHWLLRRRQRPFAPEEGDRESKG